MPLLDVQGLSKQFTIHHLERQIPVFHDLSFTIEPGQFLMVAGTNGAGKSTLLRCLYRTYLPSEGRALYYAERGVIDLARAADVDISWLRGTELGFVTQFLRPRPRVSALELVAEPLRTNAQSYNGAHNGDHADALDQAAAMLTLFGLKPALWQAYPSTFSGGEQQKVNLARALIRRYRLLLLDEPTASLDRVTREALITRLADLKRAGVAMIGVFHHPEDVSSLIDANLEITVPVGVPDADQRLIEAELTHVAE